MAHALRRFLLAGVLLLLPWPALGLELRAASDVSLLPPFPLVLFDVVDGGFGDLDGVVNDEILFDMNDPATTSLYTAPFFAPLSEFSGRLTLSPTGIPFASVFQPILATPVLTLADFTMKALPGETATIALRFDGTGTLGENGAAGGAVEGSFDPLASPSSIHFLGAPTDVLALVWDGTVAGLPISISKAPPDDPAFAATHALTLPPYFGTVSFTGILQVELGAGSGVSVPEPGALALLALAPLIGARIRRRRPFVR